MDGNGEVKLEPESVIDKRMAKKKGRAITEVLIR
jgi:hypothetical protein